jgi:DNA-binding NarL/FixJ family response regulator
MIRIILAEDHRLVRQGIRLLISGDTEFEIVAEAANGQEVLSALCQYPQTDIVLTDLIMPVMNGNTLIGELKSGHPEVKAIILSMEDDPKIIAGILKDGACGYLFKNSDAMELIFAIRFVASGGRYICAELGFKLLEGQLQGGNAQSIVPHRSDFTRRELEVLKLIAEGYTNHQIAEKIFVSKRTVEGHRQSLLEKTGSKNTAMLIRNAVLGQLI